MKISPNSSFIAQRGIAQRDLGPAPARNISPSPVRPDESFYTSAFLADRGVKLPPMALRFEQKIIVRKSA